MIRNFGIFLVLIAFKELLAQPCQLKDTDMNRMWLYYYKSDILRSEIIEDQTTLDLICLDHSQSLKLSCRQGTMDKMPDGATCTKRYRATVTDTQTYCKANNMDGKLYDVSYVWPGGARANLYTTCFSSTHEAALYARHKAYGFNLPVSRYQRPQFVQGRNMNSKRKNSFGATDIFNTFNALFGSGQTYVKSAQDFAVHRGHLANSQDFVSYDQMDETFKYINVVPYFRGVNTGNWRILENWVHKLPARNTYATVTTGMYGVLELAHSQPPHPMVRAYLMHPERKNPMPMWVYKLVEYQNVCYGFVTLNNEINTNRDITTPICQKQDCPQGLEFNKDPSKGVSHCCDCAHLLRSVGLQ